MLPFLLRFIELAVVQGAGVQAEEHDGNHQDVEHGERGAERGE